MSDSLKNFKEFVMNTIGLGLMHVDINADFHDNLMSKVDKYFWAICVYAILGTISYLI